MFTGSADHHGGDEESDTRVFRAREPGSGRGDSPDAVDVRDGIEGLDDRYGFDGSDALDLLDLLDVLDLTDAGHPRPGEIDDGWMDQAVCKGRTNLFFGIAGERPERRVRHERTARGVCDECPVLGPCRERARSGRENGFWGGESEEERAAAGFPPRSISRRSVQQASGVRAAAS